MAKILVIDDSNINIRIVKRILEDNNHQVFSLTNGNDAFDVMIKEGIELVLMDVMMPDIDGFTLCKMFKQNQELKDIPVIFLTSRVDNESLVESFKIGGQDYITKPFRSGELIARINTQLELKKSRDEQARLIQELKSALNQVKQLSGLLPICSNCKKIRDDNGYWTQVEKYLKLHSTVDFSHSICPDCMKILYPKQYKKLKEKGNLS
ncbi:MAG: response regulator [Candidatus Cloacimonetes bacterium]|nr:response regulator [Candidatus Cloacimonadota bacterium]